MRRLWAYIIVIFAAVVAVIASFPRVAKGLATDGEFKTRRVFTFQLTERDNEFDPDVTPKELTDSSAKEIADIMKGRGLVGNGILQTLGLTEATENQTPVVLAEGSNGTRYLLTLSQEGFRQACQDAAGRWCCG